VAPGAIHALSAIRGFVSLYGVIVGIKTPLLKSFISLTLFQQLVCQFFDVVAAFFLFGFVVHFGD
jgi:hypothetical protein